MNSKTDANFDISKFNFAKGINSELNDKFYARDFWPIVYVLNSNGRSEAYVGETTDAEKRMAAHLANVEKKKLDTAYLISSETFNKSATLDIESNLIRYLSADGKYSLLNGNLGLANHNYFQKNTLYWKIFKQVWNKLQGLGVVEHSLDYIDNSDLFKYSPYKNLTSEQQEGLIDILNCLLNDSHKNIIVEGGAGTGKTILAIFLFKVINTDLGEYSLIDFNDSDTLRIIDLIKKVRQKFPNPRMGLVVPMSSFRKTLKKVFSGIGGLKSGMVIGPSEVSKSKFDILLVDESHRLRKRVNLGAYFGAFDKACERLRLDKFESDELEWVVKQSDKAVLFYDENQSIKPSDVDSHRFSELKIQEDSVVRKIKSQFRVKGGNSYVDFIDNLLSVKIKNLEIYTSDKYDFKIFDSIDDLINVIESKNSKFGLSRLVAGYSWKWVSNKDASLFDIDIQGRQLKWNTTNIDWINSPNSIKEVGCIHTTQGYDLNYTGVIFGHEITYNKDKSCIEIIEDNYFDKNGKNSISDPEELKQYIVNIYKTILLRGIRGAYVYVCDEDLRNYLKRYIPLHMQEGHIEKSSSKVIFLDKYQEDKNIVPLYDLTAAAGSFSVEQNPEKLKWIELSDTIKVTKNSFACKVIGESMNEVIPNGSICLFEKNVAGSRDGKIVLVQYTNYLDGEMGSCYTVKEYRSKKVETVAGWRHAEIKLKPRSSNIGYSDIVIRENDLNEFEVIGVFREVIG